MRVLLLALVLTATGCTTTIRLAPTASLDGNLAAPFNDRIIYGIAVSGRYKGGLQCK